MSIKNLIEIEILLQGNKDQKLTAHHAASKEHRCLHEEIMTLLVGHHHVVVNTLG